MQKFVSNVYLSRSWRRRDVPSAARGRGQLAHFLQRNTALCIPPRDRASPTANFTPHYITWIEKQMSSEINFTSRVWFYRKPIFLVLDALPLSDIAYLDRFPGFIKGRGLRADIRFDFVHHKRSVALTFLMGSYFEEFCWNLSCPDALELVHVNIILHKFKP